MRDAKPGDVYEDANGKKWLVRWTLHAPSVGIEELEPDGDGTPREVSGGVDGKLWEMMGLKRVKPEALN